MVKISKDQPSLVQDVARRLQAQKRTVVPGTDRGRAANCARHARGLAFGLAAIHVMHIQSRGTHTAGDDGGEGGEETRDKVEHSANIGGLSKEKNIVSLDGHNIALANANSIQAAIHASWPPLPAAFAQRMAGPSRGFLSITWISGRAGAGAPR